MASRDDIQWVCITKPRCRLCQFLIQEEELVVAVISENHVSSSFHFRSNTRLKIERGILIHMCSNIRCVGDRPPAPCLHHECYLVQSRPLSPTYLAASDYLFNPDRCLELERQKRIRRIAERHLKLGLLQRLPEELCYDVAGYLVRQFAAIAWENLTRQLRPTNYTIDLTQSVYAKYVCVEGVSYLQSLHNSLPVHDERGHQILDSRHGRIIKTIYVAYDHLGIRNIHFELSDQMSLSSYEDFCGIWWKQMARDSGLLQIETQSDGLKLRRLLDTTDSPAIRDDLALGPAWPTPGRAYRLIDLDTCTSQTTEELPSSLRMSFLDCNAPHTIGYYAAIYGLRPLKLFSHNSDTRKPIYDVLNRDSSFVRWMYMPIGRDEHVTQIWAIRAFGWLIKGCIGFLFHTNRGRTALFGGYHYPAELLHFQCIYATTGSPSRLYFNDWDEFCDDKSIKYMGVESRSIEDDMLSKINEDSWKTYPPSLTPSAHPVRTLHTEVWFYTNCQLAGAVSIEVCIKTDVSHKPVVGVLIHYDDDERACLGQYRHDWKIVPLRVDHSKPLCLAFDKTPKNCPYVARIFLKGQAESNCNSLTWMEVPWHGKLEWWFSHRMCKLRYFDKILV